MSISKLWQEFEAWWKGTAIGQEIDSAAATAKTTLESVSVSELVSIVENTITALLTGLASGDSSVAIDAGWDAAEAGFKAAGVAVTQATLGIFVSSLHASVTAQQAAGAVTATTS